MKYLERMGRRGSRPFHTVISTTFAIEFAAFEELMLPQLMASGASNFLLVSDERMASLSLSDGSELPMQLGRDYELFSPPVANGLFHPKIVLQLGRRAGRLFVGSANITAAGLAGNAEAVIELECQDEPSPEREIIRSAWVYLSKLIDRESGAARDALSWAADRAPWLDGPIPDPVHGLEDGSMIGFLVRDGVSSIGQRFVNLVGGDTVDRLLVISPYWDEELETLKWLTELLKPTRTSVLLDPEQHEFPIDTPGATTVELRRLPHKLSRRFAHAKIVIASTSTHDHLLLGSANCTAPALGGPDFSGSNIEACIYRRLPRDEAIDALGLAPGLEEQPLDADEIERCEPAPPIPFRQIESRRAGSFELDGNLLTWSPPPGWGSGGLLQLLDRNSVEIEILSFDGDEAPGQKRRFYLSCDRPDDVSFVTVIADNFVSNPAHVAHRSLLRRRRREVATGSVAKAIAVFDASTDFDLWMHQAFDELARVDLADRPNSPAQAVRVRPSQSHAEEESAPRHLSYEEFMETRVPDGRSDGRRGNTLAGTHSDSIRSFLNMLTGGKPHTPDPEKTGDDDGWMDLSDEDEDEELNSETRKLEVTATAADLESDTGAPNDTPVDAGYFERMVETYVTNLTTVKEPLGPSDVLRVRFWLMLLLHKARHAGLPKGLEASAGERGWPRMAFRVISAFFCGRRPPVTRLMIARDYTEMPVDFLECWATVIWTLDAIESSLPTSSRNAQFLGFVYRVRAEVFKVLGLTAAELESKEVVELKVALQRTIGVRLGLA